MDRRRYSTSKRLLVVALLVGLTMCQTGCMTLFTSAVILIRGTDTPAEYKGLKHKRVAVVCRPPFTLDVDTDIACHEIAQRVGDLLGDNIRGVEVISQQEVSSWTDENPSTDTLELGRALDAEMVLEIELDELRLYQSTTVYQGRGMVRIAVWDVEEERRVFKKEPPQSVFPPNAGIPTTKMRRPEFRRVFVGVLAEEIGRHFYAHDATVQFARDTGALQYQ